MSRTVETMERLRGQESWAGPRAIAHGWMRVVATIALLTFMAASPSGAANRDWVLRAVLSEDAATVEMALQELWTALYGPLEPFGHGGPWSVDSVGALFREDMDVASWFGEVLAKGRPEVRYGVSEFFVAWLGLFVPEWIEFAAENHRSAEEIFKGWPDHWNWVPTMERLRSREDGGGLLANLSESVPDDEARRLALVFAGQMRRVRAALPRLVEEEYDRRQSSGTIGSDDVLEVLLGGLVFLQDFWGTEETRAAAWAKWMKKREAQGLPARVVGVEAPWNLLNARGELGESDYPLEGRALAPGVRRVALALTEELPAELGPDLGALPFELRSSKRALEAAVALLVNERPLADETARRIFDLYCESTDGGCFEKLNLLYAGFDDPSLRSLDADVGKHVIEALIGLRQEKERHCGVLADCSGADCPTVVRIVSAADAPDHARLSGERPSRRGSETWTRAEGPDGEVQFRVTVPVRERIGSIGVQLQEVLALVGRLDAVPRPVLDGVLEFWSTERFPEARRILEENEWLGPDVAAVTSAQREGSGAGLVPRRGIGVAELCEGRI